MPLTKLELNSLGELDDGRVLIAFGHELKRAVMDCMDRPGDKTSRTVNMELKLTPVIGPEGQCDSVAGEFQIKSKVPVRKSKSYDFNVNRAGQLIYSSTSPDNIDQTTFDDVDPETGRVKR